MPPATPGLWPPRAPPTAARAPPRAARAAAARPPLLLGLVSAFAAEGAAVFGAGAGGGAAELAPASVAAAVAATAVGRHSAQAGGGAELWPRLPATRARPLVRRQQRLGHNGTEGQPGGVVLAVGTSTLAPAIAGASPAEPAAGAGLPPPESDEAGAEVDSWETAAEEATDRMTKAVDAALNVELPSVPTELVTGTSMNPERWTFMGCYARLLGDDVVPGDVISVRDDACRDFDVTSGAICRSGLPFYRFVANELTPGVCKDYCLGKGLDICGLVSNKECRCGATTRIGNFWGVRGLRPHLLFQREDMRLEDGDTACEIVAFKYIGELPDGRVPASLSVRTALDQAYLNSIGCPNGECGLRDTETV